MKIQMKFFVTLFASIFLINAILCTPQREPPQVRNDGSQAESPQVTLGERVNWAGVFEGSFQVFNGARKVYNALQEE